MKQNTKESINNEFKNEYKIKGCISHNIQNFEYYCKNHKQYYCRICLIDFHRNCDVLNLKNINQDSKEMFFKFLEDLKDFKSITINLLNIIEEILKFIQIEFLEKSMNFDQFIERKEKIVEVIIVKYKRFFELKYNSIFCKYEIAFKNLRDVEKRIYIINNPNLILREKIGSYLVFQKQIEDSKNILSYNEIKVNDISFEKIFLINEKQKILEKIKKMILKQINAAFTKNGL